MVPKKSRLCDHSLPFISSLMCGRQTGVTGDKRGFVRGQAGGRERPSEYPPGKIKTLPV